jgi:tyrosyl-tRNA synthetase
MEKIDAEAKAAELISLTVVECIDPDGSFKKKLKAKIDGSYKGEVVIKLGVDPTRPDIHLGHAVLLKKLRTFQDVGCKVIFLVGDYTASIGDPSGKSRVRAEVETAEIEKNMETYVEQVGKILRTDPSVYSWVRNSDWFYGITDLLFDPATKTGIEFVENGTKKNIPIEANSFVGKALLYENSRMQKTHLGRHETVSLTLKGLLWTLKHISHARLIGRDMFQDRIRRNEELYMHEMLYPVLQGIDSSVIARIYGSCDLEIGGTDQTFNMLLGRDVMRANNQPEQAVMTMVLMGRKKCRRVLITI